MIEMFGKFLPFGQYFYLYVRDNLEEFKKIIKNFLVVRLEKSINSEKIFSINVLNLLDLYIPPINALIVVKVIDQDGGERFSLEISNYPQEVFLAYENGISIFASENEKIMVEFYALDDNLLSESIRKFKNLYEEKGEIISVLEDVNNEIKNLANSIGYELTSPGVNIERTEMAKKFIQLLETLIMEKEVM